MSKHGLGEEFGWLWGAFAVSTYGTWLGFGAFSALAIGHLGAGAVEVAALSSAALVVGAGFAIPLGPWIDARAKRPVMITAELARFAALATVPIAYCSGALTFVQLLVVAIVSAAGKIGFAAASGAYLKSIVRSERMVMATSRFESTTWSAAIVGPPLGGVAIGFAGPVTTIVLDAVSYLVSALGIAAIRRPEPPPTTGRGSRHIVDGWRHILMCAELRQLFANTVLVNALIMATEPVLAVRLLGELRYPLWQYGLAFAVPCVGGVIGARAARRIAVRLGERRVLRLFGTLRACWILGLMLVQPGVVGLLVVMITEFGLIVCASVFNPVFAAYRLTAVDTGNISRVLAAWSITTAMVTAAFTLTWGVLAHCTSPHVAIAAAGVLLLGTPFLLPRTPPLP